jgi:hypothetical protein
LTTTLRYYGEFIPKRRETWADILERGVLEPTPQVVIPEPETRTKGEAAPDWDAELGELTTEKSGAGGGSRTRDLLITKQTPAPPESTQHDVKPRNPTQPA